MSNFHFEPEVSEEQILQEQLRDYEFEKWLDEVNYPYDAEDRYSTLSDYEMQMCEG